MGLLADALAIASNGWPVFPCGNNKMPAIAGGNGFHDASADEAQIRSLFAKAPHAALVGTPTGEVSGFDVLDIDYRNGGGEWETPNAHRLPDTRIHSTMSGGRHYLFRHAPGVRNSSGRQRKDGTIAGIALGVDVRGEGGYVILPPSIGYSIINDTDIAEWPDWLLEIILSSPEPQKINGHAKVDIDSKRLDAFVKSILSQLSRAADGSKHFQLRNAALSIGGIMQAAGLSEASASQALLDALPRSVKDWSNAKRTIAWGLKHGKTQPIELPDRPEYHRSQPTTAATPEPAAPTPSIIDPWNTLSPVPFPSECLPSPLQEFVAERASVIGADPCAIAWACLSACSCAIPATVRLQMKRHDTWTVPPAIWVALIGAPSTKKTPIIDTAWWPLQKTQTRDLQNYQNDKTGWELLPKALRTGSPEPPLPRRLVSHDATMEALQDIMARQDRGIGVLRDELAGWIGSMEKYAPGKGGAADRAFALQSYNGGPHVVDRVGRGTLAISNLLVTVCGGIQPDRLRQFGDITDDGLWQRFIPIIVAQGSIGTDTPSGPHTETYNNLVNQLLLTPSMLRLALHPDAHSIREDVQNRTFELEQSEILGNKFVGFVGKLLGVWGRIALVLHLIRNRDSIIIPAQVADEARTLLFSSVLPNAARVYATMGGAGADLEATQSIAGYILTKKLDRIVASDLTSNVRICRNRSLEDLRKLLSPLEAGGWLLPERDFNPTAWAVSNFVHVKFKQQAEKETRRRDAVRQMLTEE